jgi:hypothetical protein
LQNFAPLGFSAPQLVQVIVLKPKRQFAEAAVQQ